MQGKTTDHHHHNMSYQLSDCYRKAFYPYFLHFISRKLGVHFHPSYIIGAGHSWEDYIYSLPTLYGGN